MMKQCSGLCLTGPLDGKLVVHYHYVYAVAETQDLHHNVIPLRGDPNVMPRIDVFNYVWFKHGNRGFWVPEPVLQGKRYLHRIWEHPAEFIVDTLMRAYRPEGF